MKEEWVFDSRESVHGWMCGGQRPILSIHSKVPVTLIQDRAPYLPGTLPHRQVFRKSHVSVHIVTDGVRNTCHHTQVFLFNMDSRNPNSGPYVSKTSVLLNEPFPQLLVCLNFALPPFLSAHTRGSQGRPTHWLICESSEWKGQNTKPDPLACAMQIIIC